MRPCRKCGVMYQETDYQIKKQDYICASCNRAYQAAWRTKRVALGLKVRGKSSPEYMKEYKRKYYQRPEIKKHRAEQAKRYRTDPRLRLRHVSRWMLGHAIASGRIVRQPCSTCGKVKSEGHHPDYMKPLEVIWLCRQCHRLLHEKAEGRTA